MEGKESLDEVIKRVPDDRIQRSLLMIADRLQEMQDSLDDVYSIFKEDAEKPVKKSEPILKSVIAQL